MERGDFLLEYLLKSGIFKVESLEGPKGLSKEDDLEASATPLCCCWQEARATREEVDDSCWRAQTRSRELEAEERAIAGWRDEQLKTIAEG